MVVSANGELVLATLVDLENLIESESQELHEQFSKYKKYEKELAELELWEAGDTTGFIGEVENLVRKKKLDRDNLYRMSVYIGRYPSYFTTIKGWDKTREEILADRLEILQSIAPAVLGYAKVLMELQ